MRSDSKTVAIVTNCKVGNNELLYFVTNCIRFGISVFIYLTQFWKEITDEM
jgi:hypothetical protein